MLALGLLYHLDDPAAVLRADDVERAFSTTASHTNDLSVWLTEDSLVSLLSTVGFEGLEKVVFPPKAGNWWSDRSEGRVLYVAHKRHRFPSSVFGRA